MRISWRVSLVGGIPIAIAAAIAVIAWLLLNEAERARNGALLAGAAYRDLLIAMTARNDYLNSIPADRARHAARFADYAARVRTDLEQLAAVVEDPRHRAAVASAEDALARYRASMAQFVEVTSRNDQLIAEMQSQAAALIALTDQARARQHDSNADIVSSLSDRDRRLRAMRDVLDQAQDLRAAIGDLAVQEAEASAAAEAIGHPAEAGRRRSFALARIRNAAADLANLLRSGGLDADELGRLTTSFEEGIVRPASSAIGGPADASSRELSGWVDRLLKVTTTQQRSLHEEVGQLLTYSVEAAETEQATQNIAISTLKLGQRTADALAKREPAATAAILDESRQLAATVTALPISPLIQSEMIDALDQWSEGLATATQGLRDQNQMIADMDATAATMTEGARSLNDLLTDNAQRIGDSIRHILLIGAAIGLLLGAVTGILVARSITEPLKRLAKGMRAQAAAPVPGAIPGAERRDELGSIARAANFFVAEIGSREQELLRAKERADTALAELKQTQAELIQAEKLASLGGLVAGVAHEINTPLGVALTTATTLGEEARRFESGIAGGQVARSQLSKFVERMGEGSRLLFANLTRAADLVHSFKQVAADQASGERRRFPVAGWLQELLTSLGPMLRKTGHAVTVECPPGLTLDTYPGALAQVLTNLVMNAVTHAFEPGKPGRIAITVSEPSRGRVRIVFADNGRGIAPEHVGRVFDPFFTTGRGQGSTGLGLHIVYNLVTGSLQGRIELQSRPGAGAKFIIDLPTSVAEAPPERALARA